MQDPAGMNAKQGQSAHERTQFSTQQLLSCEFEELQDDHEYEACLEQGGESESCDVDVLLRRFRRLTDSNSDEVRKALAAYRRVLRADGAAVVVTGCPETECEPLMKYVFQSVIVVGNVFSSNGGSAKAYFLSSGAMQTARDDL